MNPIQVRLLQCAGVPDDALMSIRIGTTRRQAPAGATKPLRFSPQDFAQGEVKVDVLQKIGQATLLLKPSAQCTQYKMVLNEETNMACDLVVGEQGSFEQYMKDLNSDEKPVEEEVVPPVKPFMSARDSQEYLESIGVLQFVQRVLQAVVKQRPRKPYEFIAKQFLRGFDAADQVEASMQTEAPPEPEPVVPEPLIQVEALLPQEPVQLEEQPAEVEELPVEVSAAEADVIDAPPPQPEEAAAPAPAPEAAEAAQAAEAAAPDAEPTSADAGDAAMSATMTDTLRSGRSRSPTRQMPAPTEQSRPDSPTSNVAGGVLNGWHYREFASGDIYEGDFLDGKRHGNGQYHFNDGDVYVGEWVNDIMHGKGTMHYHEGMIYEGHWDQGKHHGQGRYIWVNENEEYEGDFKEDELHGFGRYTYANDEVYEGEFMNSVKHGRGKHMLANGQVTFEGFWRNGKPDTEAPTEAAKGVEEDAASTVGSLGI